MRARLKEDEKRIVSSRASDAHSIVDDEKTVRTYERNVWCLAHTLDAALCVVRTHCPLPVGTLAPDRPCLCLALHPLHLTRPALPWYNSTMPCDARLYDTRMIVDGGMTCYDACSMAGCADDRPRRATPHAAHARINNRLPPGHASHLPHRKVIFSEINLESFARLCVTGEGEGEIGRSGERDVG